MLSGSGELHVETCINDLRYEYIPDIDFMTSDPVVNYRETVIEESSILCLAKSSNKHNRFYMKAAPLGEELIKAIEAGEVKMDMDTKLRSRILVEKYGWDSAESKKIWTFGPESGGTNLLTDLTKGLPYMKEVEGTVSSAFKWAMNEGVLTEEPLRGVRFNLIDVMLKPDPMHRKGGQLIPALRRACRAS